MYQKKKMIVYAVIFLLGLGIVAWSVAADDHSFLAGVGGGLMGVGGVRFLLGLRYHKDEDYAREVDTNTQDERKQFIARQAQAWSFSLSIVVLALVSILLRFLHMEEASIICTYILCGMLALDGLFYLILQKKF